MSNFPLVKMSASNFPAPAAEGVALLNATEDVYLCKDVTLA